MINQFGTNLLFLFYIFSYLINYLPNLINITNKYNKFLFSYINPTFKRIYKIIISFSKSNQTKQQLFFIQIGCFHLQLTQLKIISIRHSRCQMIVSKLLKMPSPTITLYLLIKQNSSFVLKISILLSLSSSYQFISDQIFNTFFEQYTDLLYLFVLIMISKFSYIFQFSQFCSLIEFILNKFKKSLVAPLIFIIKQAVTLFALILLQSTDKFFMYPNFHPLSKSLQFHQKYVEMVFIWGIQYQQDKIMKLIQKASQRQQNIFVTFMGILETNLGKIADNRKFSLINIKYIKYYKILYLQLKYFLNEICVCNLIQSFWHLRF
ncbi:unnamed protein product (macronuclear) [Paramecium tetraurelia]|uniref:Transmembrane protein n=1 Tax=Paramecium tetraurelia TaxID=5888 RepID=A0BGQ0_PARTE|nr:uncharacterized protein GSPATT00028752001 [Paramecium tetraurelia]CAK57717.1 unnamed protein product [Paramecium tetraurelia]|eukprot:XP_001425115.1 hypothetical protein (macronuclear) [Paramecium tetraurelia strain d4-2]